MGKSTLGRESCSEISIGEFSKGISLLSSETNYRYTAGPLHDQENLLPNSSAHSQRGQPEVTTALVCNSARPRTRNSSLYQQTNVNGKRPLNISPIDVEAKPPSSNKASAPDSSASVTYGCSENSASPVEKTSGSMQTTARSKIICLKAAYKPDVPAKKRYRKLDSEVSTSQLARRERERKKIADRERDTETYQRRLLDLETNGVARRPGPCFECEDKGLKCIVSPAPDPRWKTNKCLACYKTKGRRSCSDRHVELESTVPISIPSARTERVLNKKFLVEEGSVFYNEKLRASFAELVQHERHEQLAEWIDSDILWVKSGKLAERPCFPCAKAGMICRIIAEGSLAWLISRKTTRCSNCLSRKNYTPECRSCNPVTDEELLEIQLQNAAKDLISPSQPLDPSSLSPTHAKGANFGSLSHIGDAVSVRQDIPTADHRPTRLPLKAAHEITETMNMNGNQTDWKKMEGLQEFRRKSASNVKLQNLKLLERDLCCLEDLGTQTGRMYKSIKRLSHSSYFLHSKSPSFPMPFSMTNLDVFANLIASEPSPTIMSSIGKLINMPSGSSKEQFFTKITELGIINLSLRKVITAVTSMTLWDLVFQDDPFNDDSRHLSVMRICNKGTKDNEKIGRLLELYHMSRLEVDEEFKDKVEKIGDNAGRKLWNILKPLLLLELTDVDKFVLEKLQHQCLDIARMASQLNAQIKARYIAPQIFWPSPGQNFDPFEMVFIGEAARSTVQMVRMPMCFGIKSECAGSSPLVHAKSEVDAVSKPRV